MSLYLQPIYASKLLNTDGITEIREESKNDVPFKV